MRRKLFIGNLLFLKDAENDNEVEEIHKLRKHR